MHIDIARKCGIQKQGIQFLQNEQHYKKFSLFDYKKHAYSDCDYCSKVQYKLTPTKLNEKFPYVGKVFPSIIKLQTCHFSEWRMSSKSFI